MPRLIAYHCDRFDLPLPAEHRFPLAKYRRLHQRVAAELAEWIELREAPRASDDQLRLVHTDEYLSKLRDGTLSKIEQRRIGFPWSFEMVERSRRSTGATVAAAEVALEADIGLHLSGGTHHGFADHGQGFCVLNDVAVALAHLREQGKLQQATVIDLDVHQGNGTAHLLADDPHGFTFSMHGERNFPFRKCAGDLDVALPDGTSDSAYLARLRQALEQELPLARSNVAFYIAGADPFRYDKYGRLALSKQGLAQRDRLVMEGCRELNLPLVVVMGGGYAPEIEDIVEIHFGTIAMAVEVFGEKT